VGWIYQYALVDETGQYSLDQMGSYQDWSLHYALQAIPGWRKSRPFRAPVSGQCRSQQVARPQDPDQHGRGRRQKSNNDIGARLIEQTGREYMGRGVSEIDGKGEAVGGVVIMRFGENAQTVIERVKAKISETEPTLPKGLKIVPTYDRSDLIARSIDNLKLTLIEELIIVGLVILIFLWHFPSAIIPITAIPLTVILAFIPIQLSGMTANIMSLGGIAVAIGAMLVAAVVVVEQIHKKLEHWEAESRPGSRK
jgi:copper/silver efflux system protein